MPPQQEITLDQAVQIGLQHHQAGRLQDAESIYRQVLAKDPNHPDALHFLGVLAYQVGQMPAAEQLIRQAIQIRPTASPYYNNLGQTLRKLGRNNDALAAFTQAADLAPIDLDCRLNRVITLREMGRSADSVQRASELVAMGGNKPEHLLQLAASLQSAGNLPEAEKILHQILSIRPDSGEVLEVLGSLLTAMGRLTEAEAALRRAADLLTPPLSASPLNNLGIAMARLNRMSDAETAWRQAVRADPNHADAWANLGQLLMETQHRAEAEQAVRKALSLNPHSIAAIYAMSRIFLVTGQYAESLPLARTLTDFDPTFIEYLIHLGSVFTALNRLDEAVEMWHKALKLDPNSYIAYNNLASALTTLGAPHQAIPHYKKAVELDPTLHASYSNLLLDMQYVHGSSPEELLAAHLDWAHRYATGLIGDQSFPLLTRDPSRRLRIGYYSPDFRAHSVADFIEPVLANHDKSRFDILCYANVKNPDIVTERLQSHASLWRDVSGWDEQRIANQITADKIDILVDLAAHTAHGQMRIFARKPAPIQVNYLGYPATSGLETIDYRITDPIADPPAMTESHHTETLVRLPRTAWCYQPFGEEIPVQPPPSDAAGFITFGSFNNLAKVNPFTISLWSRVLHATPGSRILIKAAGLSSPSAIRRMQEQFTANNIPPNRLSLLGRVENFVDHLTAYKSLDIALDPFPYHGTTTTCEALWMGVPVITLAGHTHGSRVGASLLTNVGLPDLISNDEDHFIQLATQLAANPYRLRTLRQTLRNQMRSSPILDAPAFTRELESAFLAMFTHWCAM